MQKSVRWFKIAVMGPVLATSLLVAQGFAARENHPGNKPDQVGPKNAHAILARDSIINNAAQTIVEGRRIFRFDTFGDESFWGGALRLHEAIEGAALGGVGPGVSPRTALTLGLKVDAEALPGKLVDQIEAGQVNLDDPAVTLALLRLDAVVGV